MENVTNIEDFGKGSQSKTEKKKRVCSLADCNEKYVSNGYCDKHLMRVRRHGNPFTVKVAVQKKGTDSPLYKGDNVSYWGAHSRIYRTKGKAAQYVCECGRQAAHWAYNYSDPNEQSSAWGAYSPNPVFYDALCAKCHKARDNAHRKAVAA